jgi:hypothetical protein
VSLRDQQAFDDVEYPRGIVGSVELDDAAFRAR